MRGKLGGGFGGQPKDFGFYSENTKGVFMAGFPVQARDTSRAVLYICHIWQLCGGSLDGAETKVEGQGNNPERSDET